MATIKDVAKQAGVSVTTVSIIINGKAEERKISAATQQRVAEAMRDLGYQPNLSARRLRSQENERPVIAFFWPLDYRVSILASFLNFIQIEIAESGFDCEMMIQTYENDKLEQYGTTFLKNGYSGAIIGACSARLLDWAPIAIKAPAMIPRTKIRLFFAAAFATAALILADTTSAGTFSNDCISFPSVFFCHFVYFCHFISALLSDICHFAKTPGIIITQPILWNNRLFSY